ncbi:hypothetical protein CBS101457_003851 [Exobasidium rhododendri]|nr:hypothetical protein CBS101457_003851 [Exobasidium rhododendri]
MDCNQEESIKLLEEFQTALTEMNDNWQAAANRELSAGQKVQDFDEYKAESEKEKSVEKGDVKKGECTYGSNCKAMGDKNKTDGKDQKKEHKPSTEKKTAPKQEKDTKPKEEHKSKSEQTSLPKKEEAPKKEESKLTPKPQPKPEPQAKPKEETKHKDEPKKEAKQDFKPKPDPTPSYGGGSGTMWKGDMTFYGTGMDACGHVDRDSDMIVAVAQSWFDKAENDVDGNPNHNKMCGKEILIHHNNKIHKARVMDICPRKWMWTEAKDLHNSF